PAGDAGFLAPALERLEVAAVGNARVGGKVADGSEEFPDPPALSGVHRPARRASRLLYPWLEDAAQDVAQVAEELDAQLLVEAPGVAAADGEHAAPAVPLQRHHDRRANVVALVAEQEHLLLALEAPGQRAAAIDDGLEQRELVAVRAREFLARVAVDEGRFREQPHGHAIRAEVLAQPRVERREDVLRLRGLEEAQHEAVHAPGEVLVAARHLD